MNDSVVDKIVGAVLYEGYILYPYRPSSSKNKQRFTFGRVYPKAYSLSQNEVEPWVMQTQCLAQARNPTVCIQVSVRFLHPMWREVSPPPGQGAQMVDAEGRRNVVPHLLVDGKLHQTWQEAVERRVQGEPLSLYTDGHALPKSQFLPFVFPATQATEQLHNQKGELVGEIVRRQETVEGIIEIVSKPLAGNLFRITVRILNQTAMQGEHLQQPDEVLMRTLASAHTILRIEGGEFISMTDPPAECGASVAECKNSGTWPVLVGDENKAERDTMLSSPIILYDYPKIAPESPGSFFDGTEIDEMLTLRVMTMTEQEKHEMRHIDEKARRILERAESVDGAHLMKMHGVMRELRSFDEQIFGNHVQLQGASVEGVHLKPGDRVRIRPKPCGDVMDLALAGKVGVIEAVEQDAEQRIHLALVIEEDPGKDLGLLRQPGHRFFYGLDEVEPLQEAK